MRCIFVLFDSLNRRSLGPYSKDAPATPNFDRLAQRTITFDRHYVGSLPCMPARRELHTGRYNFLHRSWGPLEPFDDSYPEILAQYGVYSHLITDHGHYFEDGGATYHTRYDSFEFIRGQEKDRWKAVVEPPIRQMRETIHPLQFGEKRRSKQLHNQINRAFIIEETDYPAHRCFRHAQDFLDQNRTADNWLLHLETFDPHEPFTVPDRFREQFPTGYEGPILDWPQQAPMRETEQEIAHLRAGYNASLLFCDHLLGTLLDRMDAEDMWDDTALIVTTDHGFLLGEHDYWAKNCMPVYEEIAHIPLFIHHPAHASAAGTRRSSLTQTIDLMPTLLEIMGADIPPDVQGHSLLPVLTEDKKLREAALFGLFGAAVNLTDGRYVYMHYPPDLHGGNLFQYTLMPTHITSRFSAAELSSLELAAPMTFTKGLRTMKVESNRNSVFYDRMGPGQVQDPVSRVFDLKQDPYQLQPVGDASILNRLKSEMSALLRQSDAPPELFVRLGLEKGQ